MLKHLFLFLFLFFSLTLFSQNRIPDAPNPPRLVNNFSKEFPNFLSLEEQEMLESKLVSFAESTSNQIVIIIVDDLAGYEPAEYTYELGDKWGIGHEKEDNGIVILIKPTGGAGERKFFIATGKGLEGAIPDITCRQIEEEELIPYLKTGEYYKALDNTTDVLMKFAKGEYNSAKYAKKKGKGAKSTAIIVLLIIALFVYLLSKKGGRGGRGGMTMGPAGFFFMGSGFGSGGGFGGGSSSGGGGFGGFGGGGFGGGGSGGSW